MKKTNLGEGMEVYIMRHGKTVWNEKGITQGRSNNRLSKAGIEVAKSVADSLKEKEFDVIFSSPLMRTMQTANIINSFHSKKIIKNNLLIEIDQGIFTGRSKFGLSKEEEKLKQSRSSSCGMESYASVKKRAEEFLTFLKSKDYSSVLIVTHNLISTTLSLLITNTEVNLENLNSKEFKNAEVRHFSI